jgi:hypothetical protein
MDSHLKTSMVCSACRQPATMIDSQPSGGKTITSRIHNVCSPIKKAILRRAKADAGFRKYWAAQSDDAKAEYVARQKRREQPGRGSARVWDDYLLRSYEESAKGTEERVRIIWQPYFDYESDQLLRKHDEPAIKKMWTALVQNPKTGAKQISGHWCIPKLAGILQDMVSSTMNKVAQERASKASSAEDASDLMVDAEQAQAAAWADAQRAVMDEAGDVSNIQSSRDGTKEVEVQPKHFTATTSVLSQQVQHQLKRKRAAEEEEQVELASAMAECEEKKEPRRNRSS